jgi:hypothetical protein
MSIEDLFYAGLLPELESKPEEPEEPEESATKRKRGRPPSKKSSSSSSISSSSSAVSPLPPLSQLPTRDEILRHVRGLLVAAGSRSAVDVAWVSCLKICRDTLLTKVRAITDSVIVFITSLSLSISLILIQVHVLILTLPIPVSVSLTLSFLAVSLSQSFQTPLHPFTRFHIPGREGGLPLHRAVGRMSGTRQGSHLTVR